MEDTKKLNFAIKSDIAPVDELDPDSKEFDERPGSYGFGIVYHKEMEKYL